MQPVLYDTSVYISALRQQNNAVLASRRTGANILLWLSAVVLQELYAGGDDQARIAIEKLEHDFDRAKRILVPNLGDWTQAGNILSRLTTKYNYEQPGRARLTNDALIAMSAGRMGIRVITANERDFRRLAELRPFQWEIARL
ncbi:MAG TPA: type II toxin-antitoxin system VapC family toxin [Terriglobales bacterium]|jgi:predicted nucleic acid-binding protein